MNARMSARKSVGIAGRAIAKESEALHVIRAKRLSQRQRPRAAAHQQQQ
jgi:hypothetical protein